VACGARHSRRAIAIDAVCKSSTVCAVLASSRTQLRLQRQAGILDNISAIMQFNNFRLGLQRVSGFS